MIQIHNRESSVSLNLLVVNKQSQYDSIKIDIQVEGDNGSIHKSAWISLTDFESFKQQVIDLEKYRTGSATLSGMSPDEFYLTLESVDKAGHIGVHGKVSRSINIYAKTFAIGLSFAFEVDPSTLIDVVSTVSEFLL